MARPRKNSLSDVKAPSKKPDIEVVCMKCGETKKANKDFYMSYNSKVNIAPFCKKCVVENSLDENGNISKEKFINVLQQLDRPFLNQIYNNCLEKYDSVATSFVGNYMRMISLKDYRELTFADSDMGHIDESKVEEDTKKEDKINKPVKGKVVRLDKATRDELREKWGNFEDDVLVRFEKKFNQLSQTFQIKTTIHMEGLVNYCKYSTLSDYSIEKGNIQEAKLYSDIAQKARIDNGLTANSIDKSKQVSGVSSFGDIVRVVAKRDGVFKLPLKFYRQPNDYIDYAIYQYIAYERALRGLPEPLYEEIYQFYLDGIKEYEEEHGVKFNENPLYIE